MNSLEDLVRDTFAERARDVDGIDLTVPPVAHRRGHRWVAVATVAAVAAAILVAVVLVAPWRGGSDRSAVDDIPTPPAGMQWVSYHGITLTVPATWSVGVPSCDSSTAPGAVTVGADPGFKGCIVLAPIAQVGVGLTPLDAAAPPGRSTTLDGHAARRLDQLRSDRTDAVLQLPDVGVQLVVSGSAAEIQSVLDRVEYTPVDHYGCTEDLPVVGAREAGQITVPAGASVSVCEYTGYSDLIGSRELAASEVEELRAALGASKPKDLLGNPMLSATFTARVYRVTQPSGSVITISAQNFVVAGGPEDWVYVIDGRHQALGIGNFSQFPGAYP